VLSWTILKPLTPTQNDQGFNGQDTDLGADSGKSGFASGNENIDGQEEEAMGTRGEEDEWGGISYHIDGETGIETESPKGNVTKENADSQSQQAVGAFFIVCVSSLTDTCFSSDASYPTSPKEQAK